MWSAERALTVPLSAQEFAALHELDRPPGPRAVSATIERRLIEVGLAEPKPGGVVLLTAVGQQRLRAGR